MALNDTYDIVKAFDAIEDELIASMIRNMSKHKLDEIDEDKQWSMWQAEQLKSLEQYRRKNSKKFGNDFKAINKKIEYLIRLAKDEGEMDQELAILKAIKKGFKAKKASKGAVAEFFQLNEEKLDALIKATISDMEKAETAILRRADDQYRKIIYNAQVYANTGAGTYEQAVDMATKDMLSAGLNCVEYANGARHTLRDYADMAIRTATKRAYLQGEGTKRQEWNIPTVIVNKRQSPCPKCLPFCGKVFIDDVWSEGSKDGISPVTGLRYPLISDAVAEGLYHPRCKDAHTTYFEGVSTPPDDKYTRDELDRIAENYRREQKQQYAKRQEEKFGRLSKFSLDEDNQKKYGIKSEYWKNVRFKTGSMDTKEYAESKRPLSAFRAVSQEQVVNVLRREYDSWIERLDKQEERAIKKYTYNSNETSNNKFYARLNAMLRGDLEKDDSIMHYAEEISSAIRKHLLQNDILCYRNLDNNPYADFKVGDIIVENQFISTSVIKGRALKKKCQLIIYAPKGTRAAYVEKLSKFPAQRELLIDRGTIFRVISNQRDVVELEVIP